MSTFSNSSFDAARYATSRPTYPPVLINMVLDHHLRGKTDGEGKKKALDLGCGTGQATQLLPNHFASVLGSDPSNVMIEQAKKQSSASNVAFIVSPAEDIATKVDPASIDLVVAGEAAHWFDHTRLWPALARILKPGGTVAYWGYCSAPRITGHPELTPLIDEYCNSDRGLGPYFQEPGHTICDNLYRDIIFPVSEEWDSASGKRVYFIGDIHFPDLKLPHHPLPASDAEKTFSVDEDFQTEIILSKTMTWAQIEGWWRTWSPLHTYLEQHPDESARTGQGKEGDILDRFVYSLKERLGTDDVELEWPMVLMMIKKRSA
ncbi:hypothetical protein FRC04_000931 [Tulasnella sp. 424]|nr:hypothetical protein FRC04_000931 [Tulasnella sp. 424]KAG8977847.1 hypothetical protein FRC05_000375 [Tulasnella sp. 425]